MRNFTTSQNAICFASKQIEQRFVNGGVARVVAIVRLYFCGMQHSWSALCHGFADLSGRHGIASALVRQSVPAWTDGMTRRRSMTGRPTPPDFRCR